MTLNYRWSSYPLFAATKGRPPWFEPRVVLGEFGCDDTSSGRRAYAQRMRGRAVEELTASEELPELAEVRRGWCLGGPSFRERMLRLLEEAGERLPEGRRSAHDAVVQREHGVSESERLLEAGLRQLGLERGALGSLKKGDARKAALAAMIRARTAVSNAWIAEALHLGHVSRVSHCVRRASPDVLQQLSRCLIE